jgi:peptide/nickel transport system substrate-binding protein
MKFSRWFVLVLALVAMLAVFGTAAAQDGEVVIVIGWEQEPDLPEIISGSAFSEYLDEFYARDLYDWDTERNIYPVMLTEIPTYENGGIVDVETPNGPAPQVTYRLHEGMLWSDGEEVTTADCAVIHKLYMQPDALDSFQRGFYPSVVESFEIVDDYTFTVTYNTPFPDFFVDAPSSCAYPSHLIDPFMDADGDGVYDANFDESPYAAGFRDVSQLVGYGPYIMSEYNVGEGIVFTRNPNWGVNEWEVVPAIDTVILQFILESEQMENALEVGDIDMAFNFDAVNNGYVEMENVGIFTTPGVFYDALWFNSGPNAFAAMQDVRVREALVHAIDRRTIAQQFAGTTDLQRSWFSDQYVPDDLPFREYDVELARQLLTEAGWVDHDGDESADNTAPTLRVSQGVEGVEDGTPVILRFYTTPVLPRPDVQVVVQGYLAAVGVRTQTFVVNGPTVLFAPYGERGVLYTGEYDIAMYALSSSPISPAGSVDNFHCSGIPGPENPEGRNNTWFCDPEYDRLDDLVAQTNDPTERLEYHYQLEPLFYNAAVWHGIRPRLTAYAVRTDRWNIDTFMNVGTLSGNYFQDVESWQPAS